MFFLAAHIQYPERKNRYVSVLKENQYKSKWKIWGKVYFLEIEKKVMILKSGETDQILTLKK